MTPCSTPIIDAAGYHQVAEVCAALAIRMTVDGHPRDETYRAVVGLVMAGIKSGPWQGWNESARETAVAVGQRTVLAVLDQLT